MSDLDQLEQQLIADIAGSGDEPALEGVRIAALGKKGRVSELMKGLGAMSPDERKVMGPALNGLRDRVAEAIAARKAALYEVALEARLATERTDVTLPVRSSPLDSGRIHPVSQVMEETLRSVCRYGVRHR